MLFAMIGIDHHDGLDNRMAVRPDHLKHIEALGDKVVFVGPFLDDEGHMNGSLVIIEAADRHEAEALLKHDPYIVNHVFARYDIRPFKLAINKTAGR